MEDRKRYTDIEAEEDHRQKRGRGKSLRIKVGSEKGQKPVIEERKCRNGRYGRVQT